jgi:hypothetical protein
MNFVSNSQSTKKGNNEGITDFAQRSNETETDVFTVLPYAANNNTVMITATVVILLFNLFTLFNMQGTNSFCIIFYKGEIINAKKDSDS